MATGAQAAGGRRRSGRDDGCNVQVDKQQQASSLHTHLCGQALRHSMHSTQFRLSTSCSHSRGRQCQMVYQHACGQAGEQADRQPSRHLSRV
jgi:hypothetical protein